MVEKKSHQQMFSIRLPEIAPAGASPRSLAHDVSAREDTTPKGSNTKRLYPN